MLQNLLTLIRQNDIFLLGGEEMKNYTVKEVAKTMDTSEETVRRWIRSGKLKASMDSKKEGSVITEAMLKEFVKATPKYAAAMAAPLGGIVAGSALLLGTIVASSVGKSEAIKRSEVGATEIEKMLLENMAESKSAIKRKKTAIADLEKEIKAEENKIKSIKYMLNELRKENE